MPARQGAIPRINFATFLLAMLCFGVAACSSNEAWIDNDRGHDYRFTFSDGSWLRGPAELYAKLTLDSGEEYWIHLTADNGEMASVAAHRWSTLLNNKREKMAVNSSNSFVIRRVQRLVLLKPLRGLESRDLGESR